MIANAAAWGLDTWTASSRWLSRWEDWVGGGDAVVATRATGVVVENEGPSCVFRERAVYGGRAPRRRTWVAENPVGPWAGRGRLSGGWSLRGGSHEGAVQAV